MTPDQPHADHPLTSATVEEQMAALADGWNAPYARLEALVQSVEERERAAAFELTDAYNRVHEAANAAETRAEAAEQREADVRARLDDVLPNAIQVLENIVAVKVFGAIGTGAEPDIGGEQFAIDELRALLEADSGSPRRESVCDRCGGVNPMNWHAPSPLWNAVMRAEGVEEIGFCCPSCFIEVARERGIESHKWHLTIDGIDIAALWQDVDGRTWDAATCLWASPSPVEEDWRG